MQTNLLAIAQRLARVMVHASMGRTLFHRGVAFHVLQTISRAMARWPAKIMVHAAFWAKRGCTAAKLFPRSSTQTILIMAIALAILSFVTRRGTISLSTLGFVCVIKGKVHSVIMSGGGVIYADIGGLIADMRFLF